MADGIRSVALTTGVTLEYAEQGGATGVPVVFLHGIGDSRRSFERVLPHLPRTVRAFALTQRGHGESSRPEDGYRNEDMAADVAAFLDALHLDRAVVVGHSMGSTIAQRFGVDHPDRALGLVLTSAFYSLADSEAAQELHAAVATIEDPVDPAFVRQFQESTLARPVPPGFFETVVQESLKLPARVWKALVAASLQGEFSSALDQIEAPTLLIWGDRDEMVPRSDQDALVAAIPDARLLVYRGAGHAVPWEEPERLASDLASFVEAVGGSQVTA